jgi:hypothetical protein
MASMRTARGSGSREAVGQKQIGEEARGGSRSLFLLLWVLGAASLGGCTLTVPLAKPAPSPFQYVERREEPVSVVVKDARPAAERKLTKGKLSVEITGAGEDLAFLSDALVAELKARGVNAVAGTAGDAKTLQLEVDRIYFRHHRASGFSPWVTFTNFRAKTTYQGQPETVTAYFYAAKIPMWTMSEVFEPTYNYPWSVIVREVVTKLNRVYFHTGSPAEAVHQKAGALAAQPTLEDILDLGFLGSPEGLPALESLVKTSNSGNIVFYALDAIGIIGDPKSFPFLQDYYASSRDKGRMFSLKAIGDLGTPEALSFMRSQNPGDDDNLKEIIDLYTY